MTAFIKYFAATTSTPFECDLIARELLHHIALAHAAEIPYTVMQAMGLYNLASPATLHRKIDDLLDTGYITLQYKEKNRRSKYLTPTAKAEAYLDAMSAAVLVGAEK